MTLNARTEAVLSNMLCNPDVARDLIAHVNTAAAAAGVVSIGGSSGVITASAGRTALGLGTVATHAATEFHTVASNTAAVVSALAATTDLTPVPGEFADAAAVQAYLAGANVIPLIEARLDNLETKTNAILAALKTANLMALS